MENKNILLIYIFQHHHSLVERLSDEMQKFGIIVDILNITDFSVYKKSSTNWLFIINLLNFLFYKLPFLFKVARKLFASKAICNTLSKYDYIDFHFYSSQIDYYIQFCQRHNIAYDITLWGSDILRASEQRQKEEKIGFSGAHKIKSAKSVLRVLSKRYNGIYDNKAIYADFGNPQFDYIDLLSKGNFQELLNRDYTCLSKINITLGYNGSRHQNHHIMLDELNKLSNVYKSKIHIILPLTYGCDDTYINEIREHVEMVGVCYTILKKYMGHEEIATLRKFSNIVINIQDTDAFSCSLQEHFYCSNIMLIGEWLRYPELEESPIVYYKVKKDNICENLQFVLQNYDSVKTLCQENKQIIEHIISWKYISSAWFNSYTS